MSICKSIKTPLSLPLWFPLVTHGAVSSYTKTKTKKKFNSSNTSNTSSVYTLISNNSKTAKCMLK